MISNQCDWIFTFKKADNNTQNEPLNSSKDERTIESCWKVFRVHTAQCIIRFGVRKGLKKLPLFGVYMSWIEHLVIVECGRISYKTIWIERITSICYFHKWLNIIFRSQLTATVTVFVTLNGFKPLLWVKKLLTASRPVSSVSDSNCYAENNERITSPTLFHIPFAIQIQWTPPQLVYALQFEVKAKLSTNHGKWLNLISLLLPFYQLEFERWTNEMFRILTFIFAWISFVSIKCWRTSTVHCTLVILTKSVQSMCNEAWAKRVRD